jgi:hypothetical protein
MCGFINGQVPVDHETSHGHPAAGPPGAGRGAAGGVGPGRRIQILRVEGAEPRTVDTVADIGQNVAAAFWFDARDLDGNGQLWIQVEAAPEGLPFAFEPQAQRVRVNDHETISASLRITGVERVESARRVLQLESVTVAEGASVTFCVRYGGGGSSPTESVTREQALACRARAVTYWEQVPLPYGRVQVPDPNVQALLDAAARNGVAYELTFQQPDGRIQVMRDYSKENGIVLWTWVRHAQLTQDPAWLESLWPRLERIAEHLRTLRQQTLTNDSRLDDTSCTSGSDRDK